MPQVTTESTLQPEITTLLIKEVLDATVIWQQDEYENVHEPPKWKGKEKEVITPSIVLSTSASSSKYSVVEDDFESDGEADTVDWKEYEPPQSLSNVRDIDSEVIVHIAHESIVRIKARISKEMEERRTAAEEARKLEAEQSEKEVVNPLPESPEDLLQPEHDNKEAIRDEKKSGVPIYYGIDPPQTATFAGVRLTMDANGLLRPAMSQPKSKKRNILSGILRRFNNAEKAESSAQAAARQKQSSAVDRGALAVKGIRVINDLVEEKLKNSRTSLQETEVECVSCLEDFSPRDMVQAPCHSYCTECFHRLIWTACENEQQWPPKCCLNNIPESTILSGTCTYHELYTIYKAKSEEWSIPVSERIYCNKPACAGVFIRPVYINRAENVARCGAGHYICTLCRGPRHENQTCPQDRDLQRTEELAEEEGWKRCYRCHAFVEHREACQHMTCRCGAQFCYVCGSRWRTCACTMEQLHTIKSEAAVRRQVRQTREAQEEVDIAEALRLVEEFEREEARKVTLLRLEMERIENERQEKELRERLRLEGERRQAVDLKFQNIHLELNDLHEHQRVEVVRQHGKENNALNYKSESAITTLKEHNDRERDLVVTASTQKLNDFTSKLDHEHTARVLQERQVEEEYHWQLKAYWTDKTNGEAEVAAAIRNLQRRMDKSYQVWNQWMQDEVKKYSLLIEKERSVQLEALNEAERRLMQDVVVQKKDFARRKAAELKWTKFVIEERDRMLIEIRTAELDAGDDIDTLLADLIRLSPSEAAVDADATYDDTMMSFDSDTEQWYDAGSNDDVSNELDGFQVPGAFR